MKWRVVDFVGGEKCGRRLWVDVERDCVEILRTAVYAQNGHATPQIDKYELRGGRAVFVGERLGRLEWI
jgi:hypothetical protein